VSLFSLGEEELGRFEWKEWKDQHSKKVFNWLFVHHVH